MSTLSILAFVFGLAGVWFTIQKNIWCWPLALVSVLASLLEFYQQKLFGDMGLQVFILVLEFMVGTTGTKSKEKLSM
jgi:nicotinamide mononucleotide transporter